MNGEEGAGLTALSSSYFSIAKGVEPRGRGLWLEWAGLEVGGA